jgi:hypothetical protein
MIRKLICCGAGLLLLWGSALTMAVAQESPDKSKPADSLQLTRAVMCETIENYVPIGVAAVFSVESGRTSCYTAFKSILDTTHIVHKWYRRDELVTTKRLTLKSPSWATYSSIQLREADKGPWRVEVLHSEGHLLRTLRFSVVD